VTTLPPAAPLPDAGSPVALDAQPGAEQPPSIPRHFPGAMRTFGTTVRAVLTRELRWRWRGKRAFAIAAITVLLLGLLVFLIHQLLAGSGDSDVRWMLADPQTGEPLPVTAISAETSVRIGRAVYTALLTVLTIFVLMIAPALTAGVISAEREKQTMELLVTSPASTLGLVVGKLLSSLAYVVLLIVASIPLMAIAYAFGGVGPEDVLRAYLVILVIAVGMGAMGLFFSALVGRTQVATVLSYIVVLVLVLGTFALHTWLYVDSWDELRPNAPRHAPEALLWLNPAVVDVDLACTAMPDISGPCDYIGQVLGMPEGGRERPHDGFWPKAVTAYLVAAIILTLLTTQLISPTRRWRPRAGPNRRGQSARPPSGPADEPVAATSST
jgi:ABC-type transport system involved in multi-copper enzyme maturation permease subunit